MKLCPQKCEFHRLYLRSYSLQYSNDKNIAHCWLVSASNNLNYKRHSLSLTLEKQDGANH